MTSQAAGFQDSPGSIQFQIQDFILDWANKKGFYGIARLLSECGAKISEVRDWDGLGTKLLRLGWVAL